MLVVLSACSSGNASGGSETLKASEVCDGAFRGDSAGVLEAVSGVKKFREVDASYASSTYKKLTKDLIESEDESESNAGKYLCEFRAAGNDSGAPAGLNFTLILVDMDSWTSPPDRSTARQTAFTFAAHASASDLLASLTFPCTPESDIVVGKGYVTAELHADPFHTGDPKTLRADNMRLAYSAAVKMANQFDCFKESKLPRTLDKLTALPIKKTKGS